MIHIDPATLRKHPILGVLFGLGTGAFMAFLMLTGSREARALLAQKAPAVVSLDQAVHQPGIRWVTVSGGHRHCESAITLLNQGILERWLWGPVESIEVPITGAEGELLVARFEREVSCDEIADAPLTGVIGSVEVFASRGTFKRWGQDGRRVAVLNVDASPSQALVLLLGLGGILLIAILFGGYYLLLMLRSGDRQRIPPSLRDAIEPS